mmetsp:Transcript_21875/g.28314  ORF Transcript_21875/g.28314 Transcript_21875/m.28314 type:complete len:510 (-) Transcript_21875:6-1535(-)
MMIHRPIYVAFSLNHWRQGLTPPTTSRRITRRWPWPWAASFASSISDSDGHNTGDSQQLNSSNNDDKESLIQQMEYSYNVGGSDGVLNLALSTAEQQHRLLLSGDELFQIVREASKGQKGVAASMLNACMASNCVRPNVETSAADALDLLHFWEESAAAAVVSNNKNNGGNDSQQHQQQLLFNVKLDMVTYSLAYAAVSRDQSDQSKNDAEMILEKGLRLSKKAAGSKRRKALVAQRRRSIDTAIDRIHDLQSILGKEFDVLLENDDFLVVQKPAGVVCSHKFVTTAGKSKKKNKDKDGNNKISNDMSLVGALLSCNVPLSTLNPESQGLVHRLDRGTSGCILLAKTDDLHAKAVAEFYCRKANKKYLTLVSPAPTLDQGDLDSLVGGRPARSSFRVVERFGKTAGAVAPVGVAALVEMSTFTGRKHQVRVHAAQGLQSPVINDSLYGKTVAAKDLPELPRVDDDPSLHSKERFFLHAAQLALPTFGVEVEAPVPAWWKPTLDALRAMQ